MGCTYFFKLVAVSGDMKVRLHLFEFEDQPWFPDVLRAGQMDYLRFMISGLGIYRPVAPLLANGLQQTSQNQLLELGAGAGGGTETVLAALQQQPTTPPGLRWQPCSPTGVVS